MKKLFFLLISVLFCGLAVNAQQTTKWLKVDTLYPRTSTNPIMVGDTIQIEGNLIFSNGGTRTISVETSPTTQGNHLVIKSGEGTFNVTDASGNIYIYTPNDDTDGNILLNVNESGTKMGGYVGVGVAVPGHPLDVDGNIRGSADIIFTGLPTRDSANYLIGTDADTLVKLTWERVGDSLAEKGGALSEYYIKVYDNSGAVTSYTDFSTAVAAASASNVIEVYGGTYTETGTITLPDQSTLHMRNGAQLSGTFTLTGDSTRLIAGLSQIFGSGVTISGTWVVDNTYVDWFGANGDNGGEYAELNAAFGFAELTSGATVVFQNKDYYIETDADLDFNVSGTIEGNGATLHITHAGTSAAINIRPAGTIMSSYESLTEDFNYGEPRLKFSSGSTLFGSLAAGDYVKIRSDVLLSPIEYPLMEIGEILRIKSITDTTVTFYMPSDDNYLVSDNAEIAEISMIDVTVKDLNIVGNEVDNATALIMYACANSNVYNVSISSVTYTGIRLLDTYATKITDYIASGIAQSGAGYGIHLMGGNMYTTIDNSTFQYCRHGISHGGYENQGGIAHQTRINNCTSQTNRAAAFDAHRMARGILFSNCTAIGGLYVVDTADYKGTYNAGTTYSSGDIVTYGTMMYEANQSTTGDDPSDGVDSSWVFYNNTLFGFYISGDYATISNCKVINCNKGVGTSLNGQTGININGLECVNSGIGISIYDSLRNSKITNINVIYSDKNIYKPDNYLIQLDSAQLYDVYFGNFSGMTGGVKIANNRVRTDLKFDNIDCRGKLFQYASLDDTATLYMNSATIELQPEESYAVYHSDGQFESLVINNLYIDSLFTYFLQSNTTLNNIRIGNVYVNNPSVDAKLLVGTTFNNISIEHVTTTGVNDLDIAYASDAIGNFYIGSTTGIIGYYYNTTPTLQTYGGGQTYPTISRGTGSPESVVKAYGGSMYINASAGDKTTIYLKESPAGSATNTGWKGILSTTALGDYTFSGDNMSIDATQVFKANIGRESVSIGVESGAVTTAFYNVFLGRRAGYSQGSSDGRHNVYIGRNAGYTSALADSNVFIGSQSGYANTTGSRNVYLGAWSGRTGTTSSGNIFIGHAAGENETGSNKLYIENSNSATPLIGGDFSANTLTINGTVINPMGTIANNDDTPSFAGGNVWKYNGTANSVSLVSIDDHVVGAFYTIIGNSATYTITVIDGTPGGGDSFNLNGSNWVGGQDDVLVLYCYSADNFIEVSRSDN